MIKRLFSVTLAAFFTVNVQAAFTFTPKENNKVGLYLGGQIWQSVASGFFGEKNTLIDFNLKKEQQNNFFVAFVHPYSLLPNARISITTIDTKGEITSTQAFNFGDGTFTIGDNVNASFNVSYVDYTLYYGLFNNRLFSFDLGLTARDFNGDVTVTRPKRLAEANCYDDLPETVCGESTDTDTPTGKIKTDEVLPMLYAATNISLPLTNLSVFAQGDFSFVDDHSISDYQVGLSYDLNDSRVVDFNVTLGYRVVKIAFEDLNNLYTDLDFKGVFVGVITHF
ncbi:TIGR04219 family outer membrane beta-barrel protein [Colwellia sp. 1_MG-2023]|uniref:TIGR04219 family outer membrane beta-barrel protein n=1 Tax=Colwellia sp. 1_MG-2023 TaxID=3062649 RepID=UPI0026E1EE56|nr:TIGR04219 family outer membrane beta-barrel protein [Colwellia sp. 1_MG-2023]MDO6447248.1 TIGR04219 family outer membrane beta-barrel protein [Colwellia sp. 1_MG-2023]